MTQRTCAICKRPADDPAYAPFCSKRCADVDLQRWFSGVYAVAGAPAEDEDEAAGTEAGRRETDPL